MEKYRTEPITKTVEVYWGCRLLELCREDIRIIDDALEMYYRAMRKEEDAWGHYEDGVNPAGQEANAVWVLRQEIQNQIDAQEEEMI
jgi:hypothetical protein